MFEGYKTIAFNVLMAIILIYRAFNPSAEVPGEAEVHSFIDQLLQHWDAVVTIVGNLVLRYFTKVPIFNKFRSLVPKSSA